MVAIQKIYQDAYARCRRRYPTVDLSLEDWLDRAAASGVEFERLCHEDLFLATACARGDRIAWEHFADDYLPLLQRIAAQSCRLVQESEDLAQEIVTSLIANKPKLAGYSGRGSLAGWLRVTVAHSAIDRFRQRRKELSLQELEERNGPVPIQASAPDHPGDPLDALWGPVLNSILTEQIRSLSARDRLLLGLYYVHGVSLSKIGRQFGVHEATASRWLDGLRQGIRKRVERELRSRHGLRRGEIRDLWKWVTDQDCLHLADILSSRCETKGSADASARTQSLEHKA